MAEHSTLTGTQLHEPKGVAAASSGQVYIADGAASGAWTTPVKYYTLTVELDDISTSSSAYVAVPFAGTVTKVSTVLHGTIGTADAAITTKINTTAITNGGVTVAYTGSAAGDVDSTTPSAANVVAAGDYLAVTTDGASTTSTRLTVTFLISHA